MKRLLLDTHIFVWAMEDSHNLSKDIKSSITDPQNKIYVSVASVWEIAIKRKKEKIRLNFDVKLSIKSAGFEIIPIQAEHALNTEKLPLYHTDPFDRMLISQAKAEGLTLVTGDRILSRYRVAILLEQTANL